MLKTLEGKKIAIVIAFRDFRDIEYFIPRQILEGAGAEIIAVSTQKETAIGADGGEVKIDLTLEELNVVDFDAVVFIGGPGAVKYLDNEKSYQIAKDTISANKVLGAICIAPSILAKAGVLSGKQATVWSSVMDKSAIKILEENGVEYLPKPVVVDGKVVTANGPAAAKEFGEEIVKMLRK